MEPGALSQVASNLAKKSNSPKSKVLMSLYGWLGLTLIGANAKAILIRSHSPSLTFNETSLLVDN